MNADQNVYWGFEFLFLSSKQPIVIPLHEEDKAILIETIYRVNFILSDDINIPLLMT